MKEFKKIFKKVNGIEILKQYCMAHVILFSLLETAILGLSRKSLEIVRLAVDNRIYCKLKKKYKGFISEYQQKEDTKNILHEHVDIVWVCWFQGMEHAPKMVQYCFESLKSNLRDKRIILITEDNYKEYVQFPTYILEKYEKGCLSKTHLSDLLRLELLIKYGGTWIDATVWCSSPIYPDYLCFRILNRVWMVNVLRFQVGLLHHVPIIKCLCWRGLYCMNIGRKIRK